MSTITEALAEVTTVGKRLDKKREFVSGFLFRQDGIRDPLEKDGGSPECVARERQGIADLEERVIDLRAAIRGANEREVVTINGQSRSIQDWLTWRREVAPGQQSFLVKLRAQIAKVREEARRHGANVLPAGQAALAPVDIMINVNESELAAQIEQLEDTLGQLDGVLSLKNATVQVSV